MPDFQIGERVMVDCIDGFGGPAVIVEERAGPGCRFKVRMEDKPRHPEFWAIDPEISCIEPPGEGYDSRLDTRLHIREVQNLLFKVIANLERRALDHDLSKLTSPEVEVFDEYTPKLKALTYGSPEYEECRKAMGTALEHHYAANSHHPEHYPNGVRDMSLLDVIEMLCDWKAATLRHADGDIRKSIELNQARFVYSDDLKQIFLNILSLLEGKVDG